MLETTTSSWLGIEQIDDVNEVREEIRQVEANIAKLKEEIASLMPVNDTIRQEQETTDPAAEVARRGY